MEKLQLRRRRSEPVVGRLGGPGGAAGTPYRVWVGAGRPRRKVTILFLGCFVSSISLATQDLEMPYQGETVHPVALTWYCPSTRARPEPFERRLRNRLADYGHVLSVG
jgi:hypothetical protein